jgi:hypothetical protein
MRSLLPLADLVAVAAAARGRTLGMTEVDPAVMVRALTDRNVLRVFAEVVAITGTGLPERSGDSTSIHYITAHGVSRATGLPLATVLGALKRLTDARLTIEEADGGGWRTDFEALCRAAGL